jgi:uncharacterized membrane protein YccC
MRMRLAAALRSTLASTPGRPSWGTGTRVAAAMFVPILAGEAANDFTTGLFIGIGAFMVAQGAAGGPYPGRARALLMTSVAIALAAAIGALLGAPIVLAATSVFVVLLGSGLAPALDAPLGLPAFLVAIAFIVGVGLAGEIAAARLLWTFAAGGAFGALLSLTPWIWRRRGPERDAVAGSYSAVARFAQAGSTEELEACRQGAITALTAARDAVTRTRHRGADGLAGALYGAGALFDALVSSPVRPQPTAAVGSERLAAAVARGERRHLDLDGALSVDPAVERALQRAARLIAAEEHEPWTPPAPPGPSIVRLRAQLTLTSTLARHALRLACAGTAGLLVAAVVDPAHGVWMTTAAIIVLKPDFGGTVRSALLRSAGTVLGALIAGLIAALIEDQLALTLIALGFTIAAVAVLQRNYGLFMVLITPLAILLVNAAQPGHWDVAELRLLDTIVGCALALVAGYLLWPSWERLSVPRILAACDAALAAFLAAVARGADERELHTARSRAELEHANLAAAVTRMGSEPRRQRQELDALAATVRRTRAALDVGVAIAARASAPPQRRSRAERSGRPDARPGPEYLPPAHALALGLRDAGADRTLISAALGIPPQGLDSLVEVADAKLAKLHADHRQTGHSAPAAAVKYPPTEEVDH